MVHAAGCTAGGNASAGDSNLLLTYLHAIIHNVSVTSISAAVDMQSRAYRHQAAHSTPAENTASQLECDASYPAATSRC